MTVAAGPMSVDTFILANHNLESPATAVVSGDAAGAFSVPVMRPGGIPYGLWFTLSSPVSVSNLTLTIASNPTDIRIGEFIVGLKEELAVLLNGNDQMDESGMFDHDDEGDVGSLPPYDPGWERMTFTGSLLATGTERQFVRDWVSGARGNTRPGVIIPYADVNEAYVVKVSQCSFQEVVGEGNRLYDGQFTFLEFKRNRWGA